MQLTLQRGTLKEALSGFSKIVNGRTRLPVLGCARFRVHDGQAEAEVTDLDQNVCYRFNNAHTRAEGGEGTFVLPLDALRRLTTGNATDSLSFTPQPTGKDEAPVVEVTNHLRGVAVRTALTGFDPGEFPQRPPAVVTQPADGFAERFRRLAPFASTDTSRPILNAVHVDPGNSGEHPGTMVATDARRLSCWNSMDLPVCSPVNVPVTRFLSWNGLGGDETRIGVFTEQVERKPPKGKPVTETVPRALVLQTGPWTYRTRLVEGSYPNWRQVLPPKADPQEATVIAITDEDARALRDILPGLPGCGANVHSPSVRLFAGAGGKLSIAGRDSDAQAESALSLSGGSTFEGRIESVSLDPFYLLDALAAGFRVFRTADANNPLRADDGEGGTHVLMPHLVKAPPKRDTQPAAEPEPRQTEAEAGAEATVPQSAPADGQTSERPDAVPSTQTDGTQDAPGRSAPQSRKGDQPAMSKPVNETQANEPSQALEQVLVTTQAARGRLREAASSLAELTASVKQAIREHKSQSADLEKARNMLQKLQAINL